MKALLVASGLGLVLAGCVSTEMNGLIGRPIQDAQLRYGAPVQVIDMPSGSKIYQFRTSGGAVAMSHGVGGYSQGCLLGFETRPRDGQEVIEATHVPRGLVC